MKNRHRKRFVNNRRVVNPLRIDPTRTTLLRKQFIARLRRQFARLNLAMVDLIVREDALGLRERRRTIAQLMVGNAFCPTGPGGGVDPTCSTSQDGMLSSKQPTSKGNKSTVPFEIRSVGKREAVKLTAHDDLMKSIAKHSTEKLMVTMKDGKAASIIEYHLDDENVVIKEVRSHQSGTGAGVSLVKAVGSLVKPGGSIKIYNNANPEFWKKLGAIGESHMSMVEITYETIKKITSNAFCPTGEGGGVDPSRVIVNQRWRFETDPEKLKKFQEWLRKQLKLTVLSATDEELWERYVMEGYKKGAGRAFDDVRVAERAKHGAADKLDFYQGSREQFLKSAFGRPESAAKVRLIAERTYDELEGMTADMSLKLGRTLADGLTRGENPVEIARGLSKQLGLSRNRAEVIARTEIIRAHAEGQLNAMSDLGVEEIGVMVEWSTAGDDRVCELCLPMEGVVLRVEEAKGMIPRHPNCRCAFVPANVGESTDSQRRGRARVEKAVKTSAERANQDGFDTNVPVSKERPKSVLNVFCPTGEGGGVDPTCSPGETGGGSVSMPSPSTLTKVKDLPGSTNPVLMKDEAGKQYVVKKGKSPEHLKNEDAADAIYRAAGVKVKDSAIVDGVKVAEYMTDATPLDAHVAIGGDAKAAYEKIGNHFVMDALMANHDVIGMTMDNIMVTKGGDVVRIDNGGAMRFRAQGAEKPGKLWGPEVVQLESMRDPAKNPQAAKVFAHLTDTAITDQIKDVVSKRDKILAAAKAAGVDHSVLEKRLDYLEAKVKDGQYSSKPKPTPIQPLTHPTPSGTSPWKEPPVTSGKVFSDLIKDKFSGHAYTKLYLKKLESLNPEGLYGGTIVIPHTSIKFTDKNSVVIAKQKQAEVVAALKEMAPAGTVIKTKGAISAKAAGVTKTFGEGAKFEGTFTTTKSTSSGYATTKGVGDSNFDKNHTSQSDPAHEGKWAKVKGGHVGEAPKQWYDKSAHESWRATLTKAQKGAIMSWKGSANGIRKAVTTGFPEGDLYTPTARHLMKALETAPSHQGRVYRGIHSEYAEGIAKQIIAAGVGGTWSDPAPHCMSLKQSIGMKFSYGKTMFRIQTKTGKSIHKEDGHSSEEELIGMPGVKYRIAGIHKNVRVKNHDDQGNGKLNYMIDLVEE